MPQFAARDEHNEHMDIEGVEGYKHSVVKVPLQGEDDPNSVGHQCRVLDHVYVLDGCLADGIAGVAVRTLKVMYSKDDLEKEVATLGDL